MIIGVAGVNAAGKGEVVRFLESRSFRGVSLSDAIRDELGSRGQDESREAMIEVGNELRRSGGAGVLAERVLANMAPDRNYVVDSIRHPAEVEALAESRRAFTLLWIDAPAEVRFRRMTSRGRPGDPQSQTQMEEWEKRELASGDASSQQLLAVRELSDERIWNAGTIEELHGALKEILKKGQYFDRPSWDEYFMSIAQVVASRSNCVKRKVAAVVTVDRRIISTGYNGTPRGVQNCNEGGCPRCNSFALGGTDLAECLCSHGEENAITQAAYHGVSVRGATIYTTLCPCLLCTKMIINAGIGEVIYNAEYPLGEISLGLLREAGVKVRQFQL